MPDLPTTRPELTGTFGMAASTHWLATGTAMSVLERGGNAVDAAVAAGFVLQVVEPHLNGPGGEVPVLVAEPDGTAHVVCGQGVAPAAATAQAFTELGLDLVPGTGLLAATVPGAFGGWTLLLERWGTWRLRDVLEPAITLAEHGHPLLARAAETIGRLAPMFRGEWTTCLPVWLPDGLVPAAGGRFRQPALARTYARVLSQAESASSQREGQIAAARDAWYRGFVAEAIGAFCAGTAWLDTSGERHAGLLRADDLAAWEPTVEEPVRARYHDVEVLKPGYWSQGPVHLQQLRLLEGFDLGSLDERDPQWVHLLTEAAKLAFADREAWYGDPADGEVPADDLLADAYTAHRRDMVSRHLASDRLRPGRPGGLTPALPALADFDADGAPRRHGPGGADTGAVDPVDGLALTGVGEPTVSRPGEDSPVPRGAHRGDTCHVDVVDARGLMVSATPSGGWLQSSPVVPELGFPLGTRAQMFWLTPGLPASLRPGARPRTTLSPSMALRDGLPWLAYGTPGGDQQDQWSLLLLLRAVHRPGPLALQAAIDAPSLHSEHMPSSFYPRRAVPGRLVMEDRWDAAVTAELARRGHDVVRVPGWSLGRLSAVARDGGWLRAAANARGAQGYAAGR